MSSKVGSFGLSKHEKREFLKRKRTDNEVYFFIQKVLINTW